MQNVVGYCRVSTDRQADQGSSLEAQEAKVRAMATVQGATLAEVIVDGGESAKTLNRPGLKRLLSMVNRGEVQAVITPKLDRLTRSVKDLCQLLELLSLPLAITFGILDLSDTVHMPRMELTFRVARSMEPSPFTGWVPGLLAVIETTDGWWLHLPSGPLWVPRAAMKWVN